VLLDTARHADRKQRSPGASAQHRSAVTLEGRKLGELLEVGRLDRPAACSLASTLTEGLGARAEVSAGRTCCVHVEAPGASLPGLLNALEEWAEVSGMKSLCVRLNGRSYTLECRKAAKTPEASAAQVPRNSLSSHSAQSNTSSGGSSSVR
jgi:hypothetical protein